ncbi:daptide-type RiPP biosynthesis aminotransferase [Streptomyces liangshanensis]|uniref:Aspartate aminotransferase family protein n=1 Tax=Streptomyces liangshanensis TaxID=2717324 RepID=A0A6G9H0D1_9ACTN|nr:daptide-type RiPP biosynthesis aminotransferase [Streptomyces liangshanensis]QIQ03934.1 aspartate aminotransferase family protein [Streptomyces liangshanensis]
MPTELWPSLLEPALHGADDLCAVSADGVRIRFLDGRELLCGVSGLWNANLGYGNEAIAQACADALRDASYLSVFRYENVYARRAARALIEAAGAEHYGKVVFSTSGGAANDLVMKLARHYHALRGDTTRKLVVGLRDSYHGLTFGGFALTGEQLGQSVYGVDQRLVRHVTPNVGEEIDRLAAQQGDRIAAMVVEPVLGSGAVPLTPDYVRTLLELRDRHGFLLVADEVATGFGRTGDFFASQRWPAPPDLLITSKGLTNGTQAAAAVLMPQALAEPFETAGDVFVHGETQAGTPVTCAAIIATLEEMRRLDAVASARRLSALLDTALEHLVATEPLVSATTGLGCFRSIRLRTPEGDPLPQHEVPRVVAAIRGAGAVVHPSVNGVQILPALTYTDDELTELLDRIRRGVRAHAQGRTAADRETEAV